MESNKAIYFKFLKSLKSTIQLVPFSCTPDKLHQLVQDKQGIKSGKELHSDFVHEGKQITWLFLMTTRLSEKIPKLDYKMLL